MTLRDVHGNHEMQEETWCMPCTFRRKVATDITLQAWTKDKGQAKREQRGSRAGTSPGRDATDHKGGKFELKDSQLGKAYNYREEALWFI